MGSPQGLYRALVVNADDPERRHRLLVSVPALDGFGERWALPCRSPGSRTVPKPGTAVWVAFEAGELDMPIWVGVLG